MNISHYLDQLVGDIEALLQRTPPYQLTEESDDPVVICSMMEDHVLDGAGARIPEFTGISKEHLPEAALLSDEQLSLLSSGLTNLLEYYNFHLVFPDNLPERERYKAQRTYWDRFYAPLARFDYYYEFCSYNKEECPFPGFCTFCEDE